MSTDLSTQFRAIDEVLRRVDRAIWIVTAAHQQRRSGLIATWVASASIDRKHPLVMAGLAPNHYTCELVSASGSFGLHLIGKDSIEKYTRFCLASGRVQDKFSGLSCAAGATGAPLLEDCLGWLECRVVDTWDVGDRMFFLAEPIAAMNIKVGELATEADLIAAATPAQLTQLRAEMVADTNIQRPLRAAWRQRLGTLPRGPS